MRNLRLLGQGVWYGIRTRINHREPLFRRPDALALFARVFRLAQGRYAFEVRALNLEDDWLMFYIMPEDGFQLPEIMKWLKQVFAQQFNGMDGRAGHIWGDRYWSEILEGEPPEEPGNGVRPLYEGIADPPCFSVFSPCFPPFPPHPAAPPPG
ncbi:MAG: transposase [Treponema sp.]|jgi:REP element-mobilizing transposase RayT|nr:transposase [Treponema sp.]